MSVGAVGSPASAPFMQLGDMIATNKPLGPADAAKLRAEASEARQKATLDEIREKGLYEWAQETRFEKLKEKVREQVLADRGIDEAGLSAMTDDQRATVESEIARLIQEAMQQALTGEAKAAAAEGRPAQPMLIDISV